MCFTLDIRSALAPLIADYPHNQICIVSALPLSAFLPGSCHIEDVLSSYPILVLPQGEENKSIGTVQRIWDFLLDHQITRQGLLIGIGGGLTTDLCGFAASTYKRGIDFIHIPTTLLAMVDASTGGKTGFNYRALKNCIGTFAQPCETIICPFFLLTLPATEFLSGYAEMLKHALLSSRQDFHQLLAFDLEDYFRAAHAFLQAPTDQHRQEAETHIRTLAPLIQSSLAVKERIVAADPYEKGLRHALNFGHTVGHALESAALEQHTTPQPPHGYCVLWGMIAELYLSVTQLDCPREPLQQLTHLMLNYFGRPTCNCKDQHRLIELMLQDKKNTILSDGKNGQEVRPNFTLLRNIGEPIINQTPPLDIIGEAIDYLLSL